MELTYEFYIAATPDEVWQALVSPEATKKIYAGSVIESSFKVGEPIAYVGPGKDGDNTVHVYGTVLEFEPCKTFSFTHNVGKTYVADPSKTYESRITYRLEPMGGCTLLTLVHDRWPDGDPSYEGSRKAWWAILSNTKTLIETGKTLEFPS